MAWLMQKTLAKVISFSVASMLRHVCSVCETAALLVERLRGPGRPHQSVRELTVSAASALSDHYATHAQLIQSDAHAPFEVLENVIDRRGFAVLKSFQKNVVNRHISPLLCAKHSARSPGAFR
jgi:hypothetical protein